MLCAEICGGHVRKWRWLESLIPGLTKRSNNHIFRQQWGSTFYRLDRLENFLQSRYHVIFSVDGFVCMLGIPIYSYPGFWFALYPLRNNPSGPKQVFYIIAQTQWHTSLGVDNRRMAVSGVERLTWCCVGQCLRSQIAHLQVELDAHYIDGDWLKCYRFKLIAQIFKWPCLDPWDLYIYIFRSPFGFLWHNRLFT